MTMASSSNLLLLLLLTVSERSSSTTVVGQTGQNITLTCKYDIKYNGVRPVCWGRGDIPSAGCSNQLISTDGYKVTEGTSRYQLLGRLDEGDVSLTILDLTETDAGRYGCRVDIYGWFNDDKHHFDLTVQGAPITTTTAAQTGSDVTPWTESGVTDDRPEVTPTQQMWSTAVQQQQVDRLQIFIGNTVRVSFIILILILIPALLLTAAYIFRRTRDGREAEPIRGGGGGGGGGGLCVNTKKLNMC